MLTKAKLKKEIENFPEEFSLDELIEHLIILDKIDRGNQQSKNEEIFSEGELGKEIEKWFK